MKQEKQKLLLALIPGILFIFIIYTVKVIEIGMDVDATHLGIYPMSIKGIPGIVLHPFVHGGIKHLLANTIPLLFLLWCLFYFYKTIATYIFISIWGGAGIFTFLIGHASWHIGASGVIYGLAFFLFFSGILRKHIPLIAISLLVTFLYGGIVWQMFPQFTKSNISWEGHLSGAIAGTMCAIVYLNYGPQKTEIADDEEEDLEIGLQAENNYELEENNNNTEKQNIN